MASEQGANAGQNPALALSVMAVALANAKKRKGAEDGEKVVAATTDFQKPSSIHSSHPYFHYYGLLVHQQNMLQDLVRTGAYQNAILSNGADFAGKTVMDVGTGSGVLAWFATQAGASKVYAVEASAVADRAAALLSANGVGDRVTVIKAKVEDVVLPEGPGSVDTLVSEPMGFMLVHEQMLRSYLVARKLFLKPGGRMFPSVGTIFSAPFTDQALWSEQSAKMGFWQTTDFYGLNLTHLAEAASQDHFAQAIVGYVPPVSLLTSATATHAIDFTTDEPESLDEITMPLDFPIDRPALCHGLACWFTVDFHGSTVSVTLDTGPSHPGTHWYQCRLLLREPLAVNAGQRLVGSLIMKANERYSYHLVLSLGVAGSEHSTASGRPVCSTVAVNLADQQYNFGTAAAT